MGQRQVDLLEARAANDEAFELAVLGERLRGQLVEDARRAVGLEDDVAAVLAVADLGGRRGADQVGRRADRDDLAASENRDAIGQALGLVEVVRRENDRLAEAAKRAQGLPGLAARVRVEAGRRLVEEDQLGVADEREAEVEAAALPTRKAANYLVSLLAEADQLDDVVYRTRVRVVAGEQAQALGGCQRLVHRRGLKHEAGPAGAPCRGLHVLGGRSGRQPLVRFGLEAGGPRELGAGLAGSEQRARQDGIGPDSVGREALAQLAGGAAALCGERPQLVRLSVRSLGMANEVELHGGEHS